MKKKYLFIITFIILVILRIFFFEIYIVNQSSMMNTYKSGKRVLILKKFYSIDRNAVFVFKKQKNYVIKRCVGLPGEKIEIRNNKIINNYKLNSNPKSYIPYSKLELEKDIFILSDIYKNYNEGWSLENFGPYNIPYKGMKINHIMFNQYKVLMDTNNKDSIFNEDYYFFVGDNRPNSIDSRVYGPIKKSSIVGKVILYF